MPQLEHGERLIVEGRRRQAGPEGKEECLCSSTRTHSILVEGESKLSKEGAISMSIRKIVLIVVMVNMVFLMALGGLLWAHSARAQAGGRLQDVASPSQALGIVGNYMNYQGVVYDDNGNPLEGSHALAFILYGCYSLPTPTCSAVATYSETLDLVGGLFNVKLGPLDTSLFEPRTLLPGWHLEIGTQIDGGLELAPRVALNTTVPWAFTSLYTESMPEPDYDSDWVYSAGGVLCGSYAVTHSLGGDVDDYVVRLDCRRDGLEIYDCTRDGAQDAAWYALTTAHVMVDPCVATIDDLDFRVRIWVTR
jgi:hypothetical protein